MQEDKYTLQDAGYRRFRGESGLFFKTHKTLQEYLQFPTNVHFRDGDSFSEEASVHRNIKNRLEEIL